MPDQRTPIIIREARPQDAGQLVDFVIQLSEEPGLYIVMQPGEFTLTVEEEAELLNKFALSDNSAYFIAESGGQIIGGLNLKGGVRAGNRHCAVLGISIARGWRGMGVGSQLMAQAIHWARQSGVLSGSSCWLLRKTSPRFIYTKSLALWSKAACARRSTSTAGITMTCSWRCCCKRFSPWRAQSAQSNLGDEAGSPIATGGILILDSCDIRHFP